MVFCLVILCLGTSGAPNADLQTIENGMTPVGQPVTIEWIEDFRIGPDSGELHHLWTGGQVGIAVDEASHVYVVDTGSDRILEFDTEGGFVRQIGRSGKGPGEFRNLASLQFLGDQTAIALENVQGVAALSYFDKNLKFVRRQPVPNQSFSPQSAVISPNGKHFGSVYIWETDAVPEVGAGIFSSNWDLQLGLKKQSLARLENPGSAREFWIQEIARYMKPGSDGWGFMTFSPNGFLYTASAENYKITRWSPELNKTMVFSKEYKPKYQSDEEIWATIEPIRELALAAVPASQRRHLTREVIEAAVEAAGIQKRKHPIFGLVAMGDEFLLVLTDFNYLERRGAADIFNNRGELLGQAKLPKIMVTNMWVSPQRLVFQGPYAYALETNEDDDYELVKYRVRMTKTDY